MHTYAAPLAAAAVTAAAAAAATAAVAATAGSLPCGVSVHACIYITAPSIA